jgi:hypothetical protein
VRQSLSRSALVLPLENILSLAWPLKARAFFQDSGAEPPAQASPSAPLGVNFVNVAKEAGLNTKAIFGGEHKHKCLSGGGATAHRSGLRAAQAALPKYAQQPFRRPAHHKVSPL